MNLQTHIQRALRLRGKRTWLQAASSPPLRRFYRSLDSPQMAVLLVLVLSSNRQVRLMPLLA
jgi:hypothetical protein